MRNIRGMFLTQDVKLFLRVDQLYTANFTKRFLNKLRYYREFLPDFNKNTKHIRATIANSPIFVWSEEAQEELDYIKLIFKRHHKANIFERHRHG